MALTPEDVLSKRFTATQFKRGYDEHEVDDFLDEIVVEMRRLAGESADLRTQLQRCLEGKDPVSSADEIDADSVVSLRDGSDGRVEDGSAMSAHGASGEPQAAAQVADPERLAQGEREAQERIEAARARAEQAEQESARDDVMATQGSRAVGAQAPDDGPDGSSDQGLVDGSQQAPVGEETAADASMGAAGVLALAQKLHDEHVAQGEATRDQLISEAQARHDELVTTAQTQHDELVGSAQQRHDELMAEATSQHEQLITQARERSTVMVAEAEQRKQEVLESLTRERAELDRTIDQLRQFERDYRSRLRSFLESQLHDLDTAGVQEPASPPVDGPAATDEADAPA